MSLLLPFFADKAAFTAWQQSHPGILRVHNRGNGTYDQELLEDCEGPYFVADGSPWLIVRIGRPYFVIQRVPSLQQADLSWYVPSPPPEAGHTIYAAYLKDLDPQQHVTALTLHDARRALHAFLAFPPTTTKPS